MKTIVITESEWGPDYLMAYHASAWDVNGEATEGKVLKCCLGFACQQLGIADDYINNVGMPHDVCLDMDMTFPPEFLAFKAALEKKLLPGGYFIRLAYEALVACEHSEGRLLQYSKVSQLFTGSVGSALAAVNDMFHALGDEAKPKVINLVKQAISVGFEDMGYMIEWRP